MPQYRTTQTTPSNGAPTTTLPGQPTPTTVATSAAPPAVDASGMPIFDPSAGGQMTLDPSLLARYFLGDQSFQQMFQGFDEAHAAGASAGTHKNSWGQDVPNYQDPQWYTRNDHVTPGGDAKPLKIVDNATLNDEARKHQSDYDWMVKNGYKPTTVALKVMLGVTGAPDQQGLRWVLDHRPGEVHGTPMPAPNQAQLAATFTGAKSLPAANNASVSVPVKVSKEVMVKTLFGLDSEDLIALQRRLVDGGFYGNAKPVWGRLDSATESAYVYAMTTAITEPEKTFDEVIDSHSDLSQIRSARADKMQKELAARGISNGPNIKVTDARELDQTLTDAATKLIGRDLTPEERQDFINNFHAAESRDQRAAYDANVKEAANAAQGASDETVDSMLTGIEQLNQGMIVNPAQGGYGAYGIADKDWKLWLTRMGMDPTLAKTPENEKAVSKEVLLSYYDKYGNWEDAATAYLAGAGSGYKIGGSWNNLGTPADLGKRLAGAVASGQIKSTSDMAAEAMAATGTTTQTAPTAGSAAVTYLQDTHPVEYVGHAAAGRASDFLSMLTGAPGSGQ